MFSVHSKLASASDFTDYFDDLLVGLPGRSSFDETIGRLEWRAKKLSSSNEVEFVKFLKNWMTSENEFKINAAEHLSQYLNLALDHD